MEDSGKTSITGGIKTVEAPKTGFVQIICLFSAGLYILSLFGDPPEMWIWQNKYLFVALFLETVMWFRFARLLKCYPGTDRVRKTLNSMVTAFAIVFICEIGAVEIEHASPIAFVFFIPEFICALAATVLYIRAGLMMIRASNDALPLKLPGYSIIVTTALSLIATIVEVIVYGEEWEMGAGDSEWLSIILGIVPLAFLFALLRRMGKTNPPEGGMDGR